MKKEFSVSPKEILALEYVLATNGFRNSSVCVSDNGQGVTITFHDDLEYTAFLLKGILVKVQEEARCKDIDFDLMIRLEKKLNTYSKFDEFILRKILKDT
jgi:hypothetical protein